MHIAPAGKRQRRFPAAPAPASTVRFFDLRLLFRQASGSTSLCLSAGPSAPLSRVRLQIFAHVLRMPLPPFSNSRSVFIQADAAAGTTRFGVGISAGYTYAVGLQPLGALSLVLGACHGIAFLCSSVSTIVSIFAIILFLRCLSCGNSILNVFKQPNVFRSAVYANNCLPFP